MKEPAKRLWLPPHLWRILLVVALAGSFMAAIVVGLSVLEAATVALICALLAGRIHNDRRIQRAP